MAEQVVDIARVGAPVPMTSTRFDVWIWRDGTRWRARLPELVGAEVEGCHTSAEARTALSGEVGRIVSACREKHTVPAIVADHGFTPPDGAILRKFRVGCL